MRRRDFIKAAAIVGTGLAFGLPGSIAWPAEVSAKHQPLNRCDWKVCYPRGGCTESSIAAFANGPNGKDPFGLYY